LPSPVHLSGARLALNASLLITIALEIVSAHRDAARRRHHHAALEHTLVHPQAHPVAARRDGERERAFGIVPEGLHLHRPAKIVGLAVQGFGPDGISARVLDVTRNVVRLQSGYLYHYAFAMLIGAAAFITWFMFSGAGVH
jgi:hypothetical protein